MILQIKRYCILALALLLLPAGSSVASVESEIAFHRGLAAYGSGDLDTARAAFEQVAEEEPTDTAALRFLGLIARDQQRTAESIALFERALAIDPGDPELAFDLGTAMLLAGNSKEARIAFDQSFAGDPDNAAAHLGAGIAAVRSESHRDGLTHLRRAMELGLDPNLQDKALYYKGLAEIYLGDPAAAAGTFSTLETVSPQSPLAERARSQSEGLVPEAPRPWSLRVTSGTEFDSNPTLIERGEKQHEDARFIFRLQGNYELFESSRFSVAGGYDGFLGLLAEQESVDLQTHNASLRATYDLDRVRLDLRYDFAYTWLELDGPFRELHRLTASATAPEGDWGLAQFYAQANHSDFKPTVQSSELNRDGFRYSAGFNQWIYTDLGPVRYLRVGATGDFYDADGHDFSYNAVEASSGLGLSLPMEVRGAFLYRYVRRFYNKRSSSSAVPGFKRDDSIHSLSLDLSKEIGEHWLLSVSGSAILNRSDDDFFDYDRFVAGIYVSYRF